MEQFADGRVFSGETALLQGFIDQTGTYYTALNMIGEMTGLGSDPEVFTPPIRVEDRWIEILGVSLKSFIPFLDDLLKTPSFHPKLKGRPLYLMPEFIGL